MEYKEAKRIREKSLGSLLAEQEGGALSSLKKAVSMKTKAKMTGLQEKFDPMNIAKFMTFGSNFAPALLGKLTGRKQSSIDYFSGVKRRDKGTAEKLGKIEGGEGGDVLGILHSIEGLLHKTREEDKLKAEEDKNFEEERNIEKARRHKELIEAITGKPYKKEVPKTATKEEEEPTNTFRDWLDGLGWLKFLVLGPASGLTALLAAIGISAFLLQKLADNTNNMKALSPEEASNVLKNGSANDIEALGGKEALEDIVKNGKQRAKDVLAMPEGEQKKKALLAMGGEDKVKAIAEDTKEHEIPAEVDTGPEKVPPRPTGHGTRREANWDKQWGDKYNWDGTKKSATPVKSKETTKETELKEEPVKNTPVPEVKTDSKQSLEPVVETPKAGAVLNQVQQANIDLNIPKSKEDPSTVVNNNVNNVSKGGKPRGIIPLVRNNEETLQRLILNSTRVV